MITTCQICGRAIKAKNGLIAHHGYRRPYQSGYQTGSCFGARWQPYEQGHDAIDAYLPSLHDWLGRTELSLAAWICSPPDTITYQRRNAYRQPIGDSKVFERPSGFNPVHCMAAGSYRPDSYDNHWDTQARDLKRTIAGIKSDIEFLNARLAAWKGEAA